MLNVGFGMSTSVLNIISSNDFIFEPHLAAAHLQTGFAERHVNEAGIGVGTVLIDYLADAGCRFRIFSFTYFSFITIIIF